MQTTRPSVIPAAAGVGLRTDHYSYFLDNRPSIPWVEVCPENFRSGMRQKVLDALRQDYPISSHSVGLSLGSDEPLSQEHLGFLKSFCDRYEPTLVSEHISWASYDRVFLNDLLPVPYTEESLQVTVDHILETQDFLKRQILVENPSSYLQFTHSTMSEPQFMKEVIKRAGCKILLDVNNIYVSAQNHGFDPYAYLEEIPADMIGEIHLAGHQRVPAPNNKTFLIDHHGDFVCDAVWDLYKKTIQSKGQIPTLIEWDNNIPEPEVLLEEAQKAQRILDQQKQDVA